MAIGIPSGEQDPLKKKRKRPPFPGQPMPAPAGGGQKGTYPTQGRYPGKAYPSQSQQAAQSPDDSPEAAALRRRLKKRKNPADEGRMTPTGSMKGGGNTGPFPGPSRAMNMGHNPGSNGGRSSTMPTRR